MDEGSDCKNGRHNQIKHSFTSSIKWLGLWQILALLADLPPGSVADFIQDAEDCSTCQTYIICHFNPLPNKSILFIVQRETTLTGIDIGTLNLV